MRRNEGKAKANKSVRIITTNLNHSRTLARTHTLFNVFAMLYTQKSKRENAYADI